MAASETQLKAESLHLFHCVCSVCASCGVRACVRTCSMLDPASHR